MTTYSTPTEVRLPPLRVKNDDLAAFMVKYLKYSKQEADESVRTDLESTRDLAVRVKESILGDKGITEGFKCIIRNYEL